MQLRLLTRSLRHRPARALLLLAAMTMAVSLGAALLNLSLEVGKSSSRELSAYGANILLVPEESSALPGDGLPGLKNHLPQERLAALKKPELACCLEGYAPFLYSIVSVDGRQVAMAGTPIESARAISPWWQIEGSAPRPGQSEALLGAELAGSLGLKPGDSFTIEAAGRVVELKVAGILSTGGSEDSQVVTELDLAQSLMGLPGQVSLVQISARTGTRTVDETVAVLEGEVPGARAKTLEQVARAGENLLERINLLMALVSGLVLIVSGLTVSASLTNAIIERRRDIGLMRSLGATGSSIAAIFLTEVLVLGAAAGLCGYLLGLAIAQLVGLSVFGTTVAASPLALPATLIAALALALLSALIPVRRALAVKPAVTLRGE